jgi:plastocyanin
MTVIPSARRIRALVLAPAALLLVLAACGANTTSGPAPTQTLTATDYKFDISGFSVSPGASVTVALVNNSSGGNAHSFTIDSLNAETDVQPGNTGSVTFTAPTSGTLMYHCKHHPNEMHGVITIGGAGGVTTNTSTGGSYTGYGY